ncbi:MAG: hypothetical protein HY049_08720 [Acidobacteria bacterium]|nr:hypothetical protein [Acidobacteriota bacterium]
MSPATEPRASWTRVQSCLAGVVVALSLVTACAGLKGFGADPEVPPRGVFAIRAVDRDQHPFPGLRVTLASKSKRRAIVREATTDDDGRAVFRDLPVRFEYKAVVHADPWGFVEVEDRPRRESDSPQEVRLQDLRYDIPLAVRRPTPDEEEICEAIVRYEAIQFAKMFTDRRTVYHLDLLGTDPTPGFLHRFDDGAVRVQRGSRFESGRGRISFSIFYIARAGDDTVEAGGRHYAGLTGASGHTYYLARSAGVWVVRWDQLNWIS